MTNQIERPPETGNSVQDPFRPDVFHEAVVPKFSAMAEAKPTRLFLIGVWVLFGPLVICGAVSVVTAFAVTQDPVLQWTMALFYLAITVLLATILWMQTRRYWRWHASGRK